MEKLTKKQKEKTKKLAEDLCHAFTWKETKQGYNYWERMEEVLLELADQNVCPHCGKELEE